MTQNELSNRHIDTEHGSFPPIYRVIEEVPIYDEENNIVDYELVGYIEEMSAEQNYEKWLHDKDKPPVVPPSQIEILQAQVKQLEDENLELRSNDKSLLSSTFELDFRLMEVEYVILDNIQPQAVNYNLNMRGSVNMAAMTPYEMARTLILAGAYERMDMEYKISVYVKRGRMTQAEADELIALMDANELTK